MRTNVIIVDNFYNNPEEVRSFALSQEFSTVGNFPGKRTKPYINQGMKDAIEKIVNIKVVNWNDDYYSGAFQYVSPTEKTWIHTDPFNMWAGVIYLTPDAPHNCGTGLYYHRPTKSIVEKTKNMAINQNDFELHDVIGNKFNRLVLYRSDIFHAALGYCGKDKDINSYRLFQVFFFDTEY